MKNTFGNSLTVTIFGESHGSSVGAVLDGIAPGIELDEDYIASKMRRRAARGAESTSRQEADKVIFLSGVYNGKTTGTPLTLIIENKSQRSSDYDKEFIARPSHADYTGHIKYHGYEDRRGGGHFSGRITAALVAAGAVVSYALLKKGISIGTHIKSIHGATDRDFDDYLSDIEKLNERDFPVLSDDVEREMKEQISIAKAAGDSVGGILESAIVGIPSGVGEPFFDTCESMIAHILFAVPAIKGVEFGRGFDIAALYGSEANDAMHISYKNGKPTVVADTNNSGGIQGGITSGMPITVRCAVKPTPSISKEQNSINPDLMEDRILTVGGRHDPCIVHRAAAVVDAALALSVADLLTVRYGTDYLMY